MLQCSQAVTNPWKFVKVSKTFKDLLPRLAVADNDPGSLYGSQAPGQWRIQQVWTNFLEMHLAHAQILPPHPDVNSSRFRYMVELQSVAQRRRRSALLLRRHYH